MSRGSMRRRRSPRCDRPPAAVDLRVERRVDPIGLDEPRPRLSWRVASGRIRPSEQACVRDPGRDGSGVRAPRRSSGRDPRWPARRPRSRTTVRRPAPASVASGGSGSPTTAGDAGPWSAPASWEMGLLAPDDWVASWIAWIDPAMASWSSRSPILRRSFRLTGAVARARAYVTALGLVELTINGRRVGSGAAGAGLDRLPAPHPVPHDRCPSTSSAAARTSSRHGSDEAGTQARSPVRGRAVRRLPGAPGADRGRPRGWPPADCRDRSLVARASRSARRRRPAHGRVVRCARRAGRLARTGIPRRRLATGHRLRRARRAPRGPAGPGVAIVAELEPRTITSVRRRPPDRRLRTEHRRPRSDPGRGERRDHDHDPPRRGARPQGRALHREPPHRPADRSYTFRGDGEEIVRAAVHSARLPVRGGQRAVGGPRPGP